MVQLINKKIVLFLGLLFYITILLAVPSSGTNQHKTKNAILLTIDGAIGPATADYIQKSIESLSKDTTSLIIIQIDTPGGLDESMRAIIKSILSSQIPVASFVFPSGARAASAGTYILYASHIAAMAPGTNLGAATPINIGGISTPASDQEKKPNKPTDTLEKKMKNDAIAYIHSLASMHNRNAQWAEKSVDEAASIPAEHALQLGVIDVIASDLTDLLQKIDQKTIRVLKNNETLQTSNLQIVEIKPDWRTQFLTVITNPSIAYILLIIGIYGLFFEFTHPGLIAPGVMGAIALLIGLYALQMLPISYVGLTLILMGIAFMITEAFLPSIGAFGIGGVFAFIVGSIMLMKTNAPGFEIPWTLIAITALLNIILFTFILTMILRARKRPIAIGKNILLDKTVEIIDDQNGMGWVKIEGELWQCRSDLPLQKGQKVRIVAIENLILIVKPV